MQPRFSRQEERAIESNFENTKEAHALLDLIDREFRSDPLSTQCFDLRIVERVRECVAKRKDFEKRNPIFAD